MEILLEETDQLIRDKVVMERILVEYSNQMYPQIMLSKMEWESLVRSLACSTLFENQLRITLFC